MRNFLYLLAWMLIPTPVLAQDRDEQAVAEAVKKLNQAMIDADRAILHELTSERLSYGHSSGLIEDKDAYISAILDGRSGFVSIDLTEQTIAITNGVAIVRHRFSADTDNKGQPPGHINLGVMQVWQKARGKWLLLARHATRFP